MFPSEKDRRVMKIGAIALSVFTLGVGMMAYSSTIPVPEQDISEQIVKDIRADGGQIDTVSCHLMDANTGFMYCAASWQGHNWAIPVSVYEDGSFNYLKREDRP